MTANELRIGNLLEAFHQRPDATGQIWSPVELQSINGYMNTITTVLGQSIDFNEKWLRPITLTEEWLLKFGFKPEKAPNGVTRNYTIFHGDSVLLANYNKSAKEVHSIGIIHPMIDSTLTNFVWHVKHVHELQNLFFALTGNELTLDNN